MAVAAGLERNRLPVAILSLCNHCGVCAKPVKVKVLLWAQAAELAVKAGVASGGGAALPGLMMNLSKSYKDKATGREQDVRGGRLECAMQV